MAGIEPIAIVELGVEDAHAGVLLSTEAHWNQNEADWRFFLSRGSVVGARDNGQLVATAALLPYTSCNAWISMVLVTATWRRRGIATRLVDRCLTKAAQLGFTTWLDATPDGAAVYGPLGFLPILQLRRLRLEPPIRSKVTVPLSTCGLNEVIPRDRHAMGFDRDALLTELAGRCTTRMLSYGDAMAIVRGGRTARHIGPLFADTPQSAIALIDAIVRSESGPWVIDVVNSHDEFLKGLVNSGWTIERPFQRMRSGHAISEAAEPPYAVAGPEFG